MDDRDRLELAMGYIRDFRDGTGIDWNQVETVFDVVQPILEKMLEGGE